jgi:hypothetical protein
VLATDATPITLDELLPCLPVSPAVERTIEVGNQAAWPGLVLRRASGREIAVIETNDVIAGELGADEVAEFIEEISPAQPLSAARWVTKYLARVKTIYAFQPVEPMLMMDGLLYMHCRGASGADEAESYKQTERGSRMKTATPSCGSLPTRGGAVEHGSA